MGQSGIERASLRRHAHALIPLLLTLAVAGCAAVHRPSATIASLQRDAEVAGLVERATVDSVIERLARRAVSRGDRTLDILYLSGGGQHGAYGVGFLRGWKSRTDAPIPRFDLVTGISTGALQAPFALIGTQAALDTISAVYLRSAEEIAPTIDWLFWLRKTGGVVNTSRYRRTLETLVDARLGAEMRTAFDEGRQLVIGTSDFDLGVGRTWDLSREMGVMDAGGLARARTLFLASSAIPGIFPPVVLDGHVHADGGVISNVVPILDLDDYRRLQSRLTALGVSEPVTVRVWVVMNLFLHAAPRVIDPASRKTISARSNTLLLFAQQPQFLQRLHELSRAVSSDVPGLRMEMRMTAVPSELVTDPGASKLFEKRWMQRLDSLGYARARSATPWDSIPSAYARPKS